MPTNFQCACDVTSSHESLRNFWSKDRGGANPPRRTNFDASIGRGAVNSPANSFTERNMIKYTREFLEPLVKKNISVANVLREIGVSPNGGSTSHVGRVIKSFGLDTSHFKYRSKRASLPKNLSIDQLGCLVKRHVSVAGILKELGCAVNGRCHQVISKIILENGFDVSHFTGQAWNRGQKMPVGKGGKKDPRYFLVLHKEFSRRKSGTILKAALLEIGRPNVCEYCGIEPIWNGKLLVFEVDHKNGKYWDDREENLAITCPNCHSQMPTCGIKNLSFQGPVDQLDRSTAF